MTNNMHFAPNYFHNPTHPISIILIGVGGTGSLVLTRLARIDFALKELGHAGLDVTAFDNDIVERNNIGRQNFSISDIGENKAFALIGKINLAFGLHWKAITEHYYFNNRETANIFITCVDSGKFRDEFNVWYNSDDVYSSYDFNKPFYWLDLGNSKKQGQFVLGSKKIEQPKSNKFNTIDKLKTIVERFGTTEKHDTIEIQGNSCSYNSKLNQQSLFINDIMSVYATDLLFELIHTKRITKQGAFVNLETFKTNPIVL